MSLQVTNYVLIQGFLVISADRLVQYRSSLKAYKQWHERCTYNHWSREPVLFTHPFSWDGSPVRRIQQQITQAISFRGIIFMPNNESMDSIRSLMKTLSEYSMELLSKDILSSNRQKRRQRECKKRGVPLAQFERHEAPKTVHALEGHLTKGFTTQFAVGQIDFVLDGNTTVIGELVFGAPVKIAITQRNGGERYATKIVVKAPS